MQQDTQTLFPQRLRSLTTGCCKLTITMAPTHFPSRSSISSIFQRVTSSGDRSFCTIVNPSLPLSVTLSLLSRASSLSKEKREMFSFLGFRKWHCHRLRFREFISQG